MRTTQLRISATTAGSRAKNRFVISGFSNDVSCRAPLIQSSDFCARTLLLRLRRVKSYISSSAAAASSHGPKAR